MSVNDKLTSYNFRVFSDGVWKLPMRNGYVVVEQKGSEYNIMANGKRLKEAASNERGLYDAIDQVAFEATGDFIGIAEKEAESVKFAAPEKEIDIDIRLPGYKAGMDAGNIQFMAPQEGQENVEPQTEVKPVQQTTDPTTDYTIEDKYMDTTVNLVSDVQELEYNPIAAYPAFPEDKLSQLATQGELQPKAIEPADVALLMKTRINDNSWNKSVQQWGALDSWNRSNIKPLLIAAGATLAVFVVCRMFANREIDMCIGY